MGGILSVWLGIGLVRFLRLGVLANLIGAPLATATTGLIGLCLWHYARLVAP